MAATFSGIIQWDNHKDWTKMDDDDYNSNFFPDSVTGLTTDNIDCCQASDWSTYGGALACAFPGERTLAIAPRDGL
jgi:hypothetical protein